MRGWKNIQSMATNIRELTYIISNGYPNMNNFKISFNSIVIYNSKDYNTYVPYNNKIDVNNVSFEIKLDDKFINKSSKKYEIDNQDGNMSFDIERALYSDTGFYAIIKSNENNINIVIENSNHKIYNCNYILVTASIKDNIYYYLINANIPIEDSNCITLQSKDNMSKKIRLEIK